MGSHLANDVWLVKAMAEIRSEEFVAAWDTATKKHAVHIDIHVLILLST